MTPRKVGDRRSGKHEDGGGLRLVVSRTGARKWILRFTLHGKRQHGWTNAKHARQWVNTLKTYAWPVIGSKRVDAVTTEDILKVLSPLWIGKTETAKQVRTRIENILD